MRTLYIIGGLIAIVILLIVIVIRRRNEEEEAEVVDVVPIPPCPVCPKAEVNAPIRVILETADGKPLTAQSQMMVYHENPRPRATFTPWFLAPGGKL